MDINKLFQNRRFWLIIILIHLILSAVASDEKYDEKNGPNAAERAIGFTTDAGARGWSRAISWVNKAFLDVWPPDSKKEIETTPFGGVNKAGDEDLTVKKAASTSLEWGRSTSEKAAKTAGDALKKTVDKVKRSLSLARGEGHQDL